MIGKKIQKPVTDWSNYTTVALWCNAHRAMIEDKGDWYEVVALPEPPKPTLEEAKATKLTEINSACDAILNAATATYPETEVLTFDQQLMEAQAYTADNTASVPLLTALATARGIELADLVQRVIAKSNAFTRLSGYVIGQRQALEDRLDACETVAEAEALTVTIAINDGTGEDDGQTV